MKRQVRNLMIAASMLWLSSSTAGYSQTVNPAYVVEMPSPARILVEVKGKDAEDTGQRQMGAFMNLIDLMDEMAWGIGHRYVNNADTTKMTPDEGRIRLAYQTAYAELWHKVTNKEGHVYDHDRDLRNELLSKFFSANFRDLYFKSNANAAAGYKAFRDRMYSTPAPAANTASAQPGNQAVAPGSQAELRRCIASGRSMRNCFTDGLGNGFDQMVGMNLKQSVPSGVRMTGDYASADGFRLIFEPEQVTMVCRGVPAPRPYTVQITDTQATITIQHESKSVAFSLRPDGKLAGPSGPIRVTGQVPAGSHTEQTMGMTTQKTTTNREMTPLEASGDPNARQNTTRNGQMYVVQEDATELVYGPTGTRTVTDFTTKTADCTLGLLSPIGGSPLPHIPKNDFDVLTTIGAGLGALMKGGNVHDATKEMLFPESEKAIPPGLRMGGSYASETGFSLSFHPESVTVACGDSERALEYSVQRAGNKTMLMIRDSPTPISLQVMADGSITGEGAVQVNGRIITGTTDDANNPFVFEPHSARCTMGRLVAGAARVMPPSAGGSLSSPAAVPAAASAAGAVAGTSGASLKITAAAEVANLLAGKPLVVLKDSLENALASAGIVAQPGGSRISAWAHGCERAQRDPICLQGVNGIAPYVVASTGFDRSGVAPFNNVPNSGTFYVVAETVSTNHHIWNLRIELRPGANSLVLDERNAVPIDK